MQIKTRHLIFWTLSLTAILFEMQNCSPVKFASVSKNSVDGGTVTTTTGGTCSITKVRVPVKILMVVDQSTSNDMKTQDNGTLPCSGSPGVVCAPPTDPHKSFRGGSIENFFKKNKTNIKFSWGLVGFNNTAIFSFISDGMKASFGDAEAMTAAIEYFYARNDDSGTPYDAALKGAKEIILNDPDHTGSLAPLYEVIFLSDGYPTDVNSVAQLNDTVNSLLAAANGRVFLSTVYYSTQADPSAAALLKNLAQSGHGQYVNADTNSTTSILINNLITIPPGDCAPN